VTLKTLVCPRLPTVADLQKFRELVEQAEALDGAVKDLEKEKASLESDCLTLGAKVTFHRRALETANKDHTVLLDKQAQELAAAQRQTAQEINKSETLKADNGAIDREILDKRRSFAKDTANLQEQIERLNTDVSVLEYTLKGLEGRKQTLEHGLTDLGDQKRDRLEQLGELDRKIAETGEQLQKDSAECGTKRRLTNEALESLQAKTETAQIELRKVLDALDVANGDLEKARIEHQGFQEYERRANKALESRESALLGREASAAISISEQKRRNSVLDSLRQK
jgi:chromosome segregation ATPase